MTDQSLQRWNAAAMKLDRSEVSSVGMPIDVFLLEADAAARFVDLYWEAAGDGSRPGLSMLAKQLGVRIADEISSLVRACRAVHTRILWPEDTLAERGELVARARFLKAELAAGCEFVAGCDLVAGDVLSKRVKIALAQAKERAGTDNTVANLVQSLADYAGIATTIIDRLVELGDFDAGMIEEAKKLMGRLGRSGSPQPGRPVSPDVDLRNRLLCLLSLRLRKVRSAARYVFRNHPDIARKFSSTYQRRKRWKTRNKKKTSEIHEQDDAPDTGSEKRKPHTGGSILNSGHHSSAVRPLA